MIINACLIFYLCWKLLTDKSEGIDWRILYNYFLSAIFEILLFDLLILGFTGVVK